jgi:hypothetical protein
VSENDNEKYIDNSVASMAEKLVQLALAGRKEDEKRHEKCLERRIGGFLL